MHIMKNRIYQIEKYVIEQFLTHIILIDTDERNVLGTLWGIKLSDECFDNDFRY